MNRWQWVVLAVVVASLGCARRQVVADPEVPSPPAQPAAVAQAPAPVPAPQKAPDLAAVFDGAVVHFGFDQAILASEDTERLRTVADLLRSRPDLTIKIAGHCDERGTEEYNLMLGNKRAGAAQRYLVALGVESRRIEVISFGSAVPADPGHDEQAWARNRRGEITRTP